MRVLIDTCVWSKVLRAEKPDPELSRLLRDLIFDNRVVLIGPIFQEILSGVKNKKDFQILEEKLSVFDELFISKEIYIKAAEYFNICKMHGVNGGHIDFLICAIISHYNCALLTVDSDFKLFQKHLPIKLLDV
jgi:predicted nucleic acid-binding protein